ncbi:ATPase V1 complex subunit H [Clavulina sp. PMI_390]|nr:ATPase V1 complex subunit H [Clavulina sp. PMI_390]
MADALVGHEERIPLFIAASESDPDLPYGPLLKLIDNPDEFAQLKSLQLFTIFLASSPTNTPLSAHLTTPFLNAIAAALQPSVSADSRDVGVQCLEAVLPRSEVRERVWGMDGVVTSLTEILRSNVSPQMNYQAAFCIWLLSFDAGIARTINKKYDLIPVLAKVAKNANKEKVTRVIIATFRNLVVKAPAENLPPMLIAELLPFVKNLSTRKWSDEEIPEDLAYLKEELVKRFDSLTTYEEYVTELESGHLTWSPVHESETFWKENASRLNERDYTLLRELVGLLKTSEDPLVLSVAAHDVGQYVKYADGGKKAINDLQGKTRVMELMSHSDADVRFQALLTVQRLVSHAWAP